ncbi:unnamed protein product [Calypogeia fissa]
MGLLHFGGDRRSERMIATSQHQKRIQSLQKRESPQYSRWNGPDRRSQEPACINWFTHKVLQRATGNFALRNRIGEGQNGSVFHGRLSDNDVADIAVKKFKSKSADPMQSVLAEVRVHRLLSKYAQPDVRHLLGVSFDPKEPLIVYEFMPKGSLRQHLQGKRGTYLHSDAYARLAVAIDVANALCELHYNCQYPIFHRDVKSSNVLLNSDYHAKLSDLGIAVVIKQESDLHTPVALGAFGYKDPVYEQSGKLDDKTDVYSFGVLLMELATHLPAWDTKRPVTLLSHLVLERMERGKIDQIIQPGSVVGGMALMKEVLQVAKQCCCLELEKRPRMDQVAAFLVNLRSYFLQEQKRLAAEQEPEVHKKERFDCALVPQFPNRVFYRGKWVVPRGEIDAY